MICWSNRNLQKLKIILLYLCYLNYCKQANAALIFDPDDLCTLIPNGTFIKDPRACNKYIQCIDNVPISGTCDGDLWYDRNTGTCVIADTIECISSDPCATALDDAVFRPDPYSCSNYYYCSGGHGAVGECKEGYGFNPGVEKCIKNFICTLPMDPNSYCNIVPDGVFIRNSSSCNEWETCWNTEIIYGTCPGTFLFNAFKGICDYATDVSCIPPTTEPPNVSIDNCKYNGDFISDGMSCNGYYYCMLDNDNYKLLHGKCSEERFFDPTNGGACVDRTQIECNYDRCSNLGTTKIQLANASNDNCRGYLICQDGATIGHGTCLDNEYFDELKQRCTSEIISYPACMLKTIETTTTKTISSMTASITGIK